MLLQFSHFTMKTHVLLERPNCFQLWKDPYWETTFFLQWIEADMKTSLECWRDVSWGNLPLRISIVFSDFRFSDYLQAVKFTFSLTPSAFYPFSLSPAFIGPLTNHPTEFTRHKHYVGHYYSQQSYCSLHISICSMTNSSDLLSDLEWRHWGPTFGF